ncbi:MAG: DAK2 domain-containing protein, partial [Bacillota bacterium]
MATLTYETFYYSLLSGAKRVIEERKDLNEINVFPVPDGDTGSNLASMMQTIINDASLDADYNKTLISIADAALVGARGNSGIIFAQYINGIVDELEDKDHLDMETFADAVKNAVPYAYKAISNPVEGTMITVMREFSE